MKMMIHWWQDLKSQLILYSKTAMIKNSNWSTRVYRINFFTSNLFNFGENQLINCKENHFFWNLWKYWQILMEGRKIYTPGINYYEMSFFSIILLFCSNTLLHCLLEGPTCYFVEHNLGKRWIIKGDPILGIWSIYRLLNQESKEHREWG